ncbi:MAG: hypothetical protein M9962_15515 [Oligoflexia bacterium]|nr:hypothetical protein [Oligoflexia bacterium]
MSFSIQCDNCGAPSGPSVGVCPYCKSIFSSKKSKENPTIANIKSLFEKGDLNRALSLATLAEKNKPELVESASFGLIYAKILLETEAPSSKIKSILQKALMANPESQDLMDYLEILDAKGKLRHNKEDSGELELKNLLRRSPKNTHALFILGSHLFWVENDIRTALIYLEGAVKERPNFLRANACLASLYKKMGAVPKAKKLFQKCLTMEDNPEMKDFFRKLIADIK